MPVGFASLEGADHIDFLYVHPAAARQGVGTMLVDALEKLAAARGAAKLTADVSDSAQDFFKRRGYQAQRRNTVRARRRMARQHHHGQTVGRKGDPMKRVDTPFPRHWLYYVALKFVDHRRRVGAGVQIFRLLVSNLR